MLFKITLIENLKIIKIQIVGYIIWIVCIHRYLDDYKMSKINFIRKQIILFQKGRKIIKR